MVIDKEFMDILLSVGSPDKLPQSFLKRNKISYQLVCYVNNILVYLIAGNTESVSANIRRAVKFLDTKDYDCEMEEGKAYYNNVARLVYYAERKINYNKQ